MIIAVMYSQRTDLEKSVIPAKVRIRTSESAEQRPKATFTVMTHRDRPHLDCLQALSQQVRLLDEPLADERLVRRRIRTAILPDCYHELFESRRHSNQSTLGDGGSFVKTRSLLASTSSLDLPSAPAVHLQRSLGAMAAKVSLQDLSLSAPAECEVNRYSVVRSQKKRG